GGAPVRIAATTPAGCIIGRAPKTRADGDLTFAKHIVAILQNNCQECHRPGQIGPMALQSYDDVTAWSEMIREVVSEKRMPPWYADPAHGKFSNDRTLAKEDQDQLLGWIEQGCPKGNDADLPPAKEFAKGWRIGQPDMIFTMPQ